MDTLVQSEHPLSGRGNTALFLLENHMSRPASAYTQCIRDLVSKNPKLTHAAARPLMKAAGQPIVAEQPPKSAEFSKLAKWDIGSPVKLDLEKLAAACREEKFDAATTKAVTQEATLRAAWAYEANTFNVTKFNFFKDKKSGKKSSSKKPATSRNTKAKTAKKVKAPVVRTRKVVTTVETDADTLSVIEKVGGVQAAEAKIAQLQAEVANLEAAVAAFKALSERVQKAAA